jgi:biopolymer transport protein ExbD
MVRADELGSSLGADQDASLADRAFSDVAFAIAFSMMVVVYILVPYVIAITGVAVNLPDGSTAESQPAEADPEIVSINVELKIGTDGVDLGWSRYGEIKPTASVEALIAAIEAEVSSGETAKSIQVQVFADGSLDYEQVMRVVHRLPTLDGVGDVEIILLYEPEFDIP